MIGEIDFTRMFSIRREQQRRTEYLAEVKLNAWIIGDTYLKDACSMNMKVAVDRKISPIKSGIMHRASGQSIADVYPLSMI